MRFGGILKNRSEVTRGTPNMRLGKFLNYGYRVRSSKDFVRFDIGALQTDGQTCAKYNIDRKLAKSCKKNSIY